MEINRCAEFILEKLNECGYKAYLVGGCVRDSLIGKKAHDWDISTDALPETVYGLFGDLGLTVITAGIKFGTVSVVMSTSDIDLAEPDENSSYTLDEMNPSIFEITTFRKYSGSRRPESVHFTSSLEEDMKRRDFTMNALAYNPKEGLMDLVGGVADIKNHLIRCLGDPGFRLSEDPLRILRALRFEAQLGFTLEEETKRCVNEMACHIYDISAERIQSEIFKMLDSEYIEDTLLNNAEIIGIIIPELKDCVGFKQNNPNHKYDVYTHSVKALGVLAIEGCLDSNLRVACLLHDIGKPVTVTVSEDGYDHFYGHAKVGSLMAEKLLRQLAFSSESTKEIEDLILYHDFDFDCKSGFKRLLNKVGLSTGAKLIQLRHADILAQSGFDLENKLAKLRKATVWLEEIQVENEAFRLSDLEISGKDLIRLGYRPGEQFSQILHELLALVIDNKLPNVKGKLVEYVESHFEN